MVGIAAGSATVTIGGPGGRDLKMEASDAIVLPAGTGHRRVAARADFLVVGAYPQGQDWDIRRAAPSAQALATIRDLPTPAMDPVQGKNGPLVALWR